MDESRVIELLVELYDGLDRLGPGDEASTRRALELCAELPKSPKILDIGSGTGAQALTLARATGGAITATDLMPSFLRTAEERFEAAGLESQVTTLVADMRALPFQDGEFDLVWSEGSLYLMGFDVGLAEWRRFVKPGGYLVVSELSWFTAEPAEELAEFWEDNYPGLRSVEANIEAAGEHGWSVVKTFHLPQSSWTENYYGPLKERLPTFREENADDEAAEVVLAMTEREMELYEAYPEQYGYEFYVMRKSAD